MARSLVGVEGDAFKRGVPVNAMTRGVLVGPQVRSPWPDWAKTYIPK